MESICPRRKGSPCPGMPSTREAVMKIVPVSVSCRNPFTLGTLDNEIRVDVLKTFGVVRILGKSTGSEPIPVPDDKIDAIRRIVDSKVEVQQFQYPKVGEPARIIDGPFKGIEGQILRTDYEKELFVIEIELLQRSVAIKLEGFQITRL
jgi:transcription antitermination factor NusG